MFQGCKKGSQLREAVIFLAMPQTKGKWREVKNKNGNEVLEAGSFDTVSYILVLAKVSRLFLQFKVQ